MEKIDPQRDHERLKEFPPGRQVVFKGKTYTIERRTTLASGEAALVLQSSDNQFLVGAGEFFAGINH